ncbi:MAG: RIP metalloprotease RseP [Verrucomicrobiae bacterium]|nr:RIP metalloprotease RseP [Verrucomicrobiae bacterium]
MQILTIIYVVIVILILFGATIFVHELGHFLLARRYKLRIERFSIGFGPKLWGFTKDGVEYRISWFPFGGYVALPQMSPLDEEEQKKFDPPIEPASPWAKIVVAVAGAAFNIVFAIMLACLIWWVGKPIDASEFDLTAGYVAKDSPEYKAGLREGDRIVSINDETVKSWSDVNGAIALSRREIVHMEVEREGHRLPFIEFKPDVHEALRMRHLSAEPRAAALVESVHGGSPAKAAGLRSGDEIAAVDGIRVLSVGHLLDLVGERGGKSSQFTILRKGKEFDVAITPQVPNNMKRALIGIKPLAFTHTVVTYPGPVKQFKEVVATMTKTISALVHHKQTGVGAKDLSGPPGIMFMLYLNIVADIRLAISFTVLLNINLAILNLLPIPVLDGGHIVFALVEWIRRRPMSYRFAAATQTLFAVLLISFILYVSYNDVLRFFRIVSFGKPKGEQVEPQFDQSHSTTAAPESKTSPATP